MPKAYIIAHIDVTDEAEYRKYVAAAPVFAAQYGGRYIARGGRYEALEGAARSRNVILEFPDYDSARAFYHCEGYQAALQHAFKGSTRELVLVEGVEETP